MTKSLMLLLALLALSLPASAQEPKTCGAPVALNDGWSLATQADVGLDAAKLCALDAFLAQWPQGSEAHRSYYQRIANGPRYSLERALRALPAGSPRLAA